MKLIAQTDISREEWLAVRRRGIGGSDVSAIVGLNKYTSPYALWMEKTGRYVDDSEQSEAAYWGNRLEAIIADEFEKRTEHHVERHPGTFQHAERSFMLCNPDGLVYDGDKWRAWTAKHEAWFYDEEPDGPDNLEPPVPEPLGLLETKTTSLRNADEWEDGELPFHAAIQVQHNIQVMGVMKGFVPALIGGQRLVIVEVDRDQEMIDMLIERETEFWRQVEKNDPDDAPAIDGSESTTHVIRDAYEVEPDKAVELPDRIRELIAARDQASKSLDVAEERKDAISNEIKALLGDAEVGRLAGVDVVTWKKSKRDGYTVAPSTVRTLRIIKAGLK